MKAVDTLGHPLVPGDLVAYAKRSGSSATVRLRGIAKIGEDGQAYMNKGEDYWDRHVTAAWFDTLPLKASTGRVDPHHLLFLGHGKEALLERLKAAEQAA